MGTVFVLSQESGHSRSPEWPELRSRPVLVVEDQRRLTPTVSYICEFLSVPVRAVGTDADLTGLLKRLQPIALFFELEGGVQDGCHIMKLVANHDSALPLMLVTGRDQALIGAADAVEEIFGLSGVLKLRDLPGLGDVVDFLFRSGKLTRSGEPASSVSS